MTTNMQSLQTENDQISFRFLDLPAEIRNKIYRLLLCQSTTIDSSWSTRNLQPAIICASHQVHAEAQPVLYGENTFRMRIRLRKAGARAYFLSCDHFAREIERHVRHFKMIQRYSILVEVRHYEEDFLKITVRDVCKVLSDVPRIKHLTITFLGYESAHSRAMAVFSRHESQIEGQDVSCDDSNDILAPSNTPSESDDEDRALWISRANKEIERLTICVTVLQPFTLLRNVGRVDVQGIVKPRYRQYLTDVIQGNSPVDHLPKMYDALQHYAGQLDCCEEELRRACEAMEDDNVEDFKRIRATVIEKVTARMASAQERLFDHDAKTDTESVSG